MTTAVELPIATPPSIVRPAASPGWLTTIHEAEGRIRNGAIEVPTFETVIVAVLTAPVDEIPSEMLEGAFTLSDGLPMIAFSNDGETAGVVSVCVVYGCLAPGTSVG